MDLNDIKNRASKAVNNPEELTRLTQEFSAYYAQPREKTEHEIFLELVHEEIEKAINNPERLAELAREFDEEVKAGRPI